MSKNNVFLSAKRIAALLTSLSLMLCLLLQFPAVNMQVNAASSYWKFDFGSGGTASGYTGVTASTGYSSSTGYGFSSGCSVTNVSAAGSGALSDAVQFTNSTYNGTATFCADVPNGLYQVTVWLGNTNRTSVAAEGMLQLINLTGNNATDTFQIPITDGQLNLCCVAGKAGYAFTLSALEISQISTSTTTNPTIWICGDSTVCNYYPLNTSTQAGWGQMLPSVIGTDKWQVRNMAASGQYAKGFLDGGQFDAIEAYGKTGDIYVISIGINDTNYSNADEYYTVVKDMSQRAMAKGMRVILVKQQGRADDISRSTLLAGRWFGSTLDTVGSELGIEVVDLFNLWQDYCLTIGQDAVYNLYMSGDTLHPNRQGATILAQLMDQAVNFNASTLVGSEFENGSIYMIKNVNSGHFLTVEGGVAANNSNVCQSSSTGITGANTWKLVPTANDGYYYLYSQVGDGNTYMLDVAYADPANGTNIGIYQNTYCDAQEYKIYKESSGNYSIRTKVSNDGSCLGVTSGSTDDGANVIQWAIDGTTNQQWQLIKVNAAKLASPYWQGDLNGDEAVNAIDTLIMKRGMTSGFDDYAAENAAEISGDFSITGADAKVLNQYILTRDYQFADAKYFAVDAKYAGGMTENYNTGFSKDSYLNLDNVAGSTMTYTVNVPYTGNYLCSFNIANASANDRAMMISVSGQTDVWKQSFLTTSAWTTWEERGIVLPLVKGINTISLTSAMSEGAPNIDYVRLSFTDEPIAEPYVPEEGSDDTTTDSDGITVYIASDSTAQSYKASYAPQQGWGYYLGNYFGSEVTVSNHSIAGRSSKSFYDNGRLTTILDSIQSGDYLIVCFGINDGASSNAERYAPVCGYVDNPATGSFEYYMSFYIEGALNKGATPILMSPTLSIKNQSQPFTVGYRNIDSACRMLASKYNIPYFDLGQAMTNQFNSTAYNTVYNYYMGSTTDGGTDFTHFTETGANVVAGIIANGIKGLNISLSNYVS